MNISSPREPLPLWEGDDAPPTGLRLRELAWNSVRLVRHFAKRGPRGPLDGLLVEVDDGLPVVRLVAGGPQRVGRQRVGTRHRRLLLQQAAEDALVVGFEDRELGHADDLSDSGR